MGIISKQPQVSQPGQPVPQQVTPKADFLLSTAHLFYPAQTGLTPQMSGLAAATPQPSPVGLGEKRQHKLSADNKVNYRMLSETIADTAAAAKALATGQNRSR